MTLRTYSYIQLKEMFTQKKWDTKRTAIKYAAQQHIEYKDRDFPRKTMKVKRKRVAK
jgi:hypothetical protein